jgi:HEAT repeats
MKRLSVLVLLSISLCAFGQPTARLANAQVQNLSASGGLAKTVEPLVANSKGPTWIGYAVATQSRKRMICCCSDSLRNWGKHGGCAGGCRLDNDSGASFFNSSDGPCVSDQPQTHILVFLRAQAGKITQVRPFTPDCALDAKNLPVYWLTDVRDAESVAFLASLAGRKNDLATLHSDNGVLDAIALHNDASADAALESFMVPASPSKLREQAAFWMGEERGHHGFEVLRRYIRSDQDAGFRDHLTFAISQSGDDEAVGELLRTAHQDASSHVRGQALFWLAQQAGSKVVGEISDAIDNDPDTDVKKKAVFALTQMPEHEGVSKLIEVASKNRNMVVRREAIFWLGQSDDPRALAFIEQILLR